MKILRIFSICLIMIVFGLLQSYGQYVTLEGRQFKDENGNDFYPVACNYIVGYFYTYTPSEFYLGPESDGWGYECENDPTCDAQIYRNFMQLKHMNFNTIRLFGGGPVYADTLSDTTQRGFRINLYHRLPDGSSDYTKVSRRQGFIHFPCETDSVALRIFAQIDRVLVQANRAGLKVILLVGGAKKQFYPMLDNVYPKYLSCLARHIANDSPDSARNALMAYDLLNEPSMSGQTGWPWDISGYFKKSTVCHRVAGWYDAMKQNDPSHLVTIGAGGVFDDILEYDISVLKLDFASPHLYPLRSTYENDSSRFTSMMNLYGVKLFKMITSETTFTINLSTLPKGAYLIKIYNDMESQTKKIIIQ